MEELALHILDIAENSILASASRVEVRIVEDEVRDVMSIDIIDDGKGMAPEMLAQVTDPFFSTKPGHRTGLGVPLLGQAARDAGGALTVESSLESGTRIAATFRHGHPDRMPLGNLRETMAVLVCSHPEVQFVCEHVRNGQSVYHVDTAEDARATAGWDG